MRISMLAKRIALPFLFVLFSDFCSAQDTTKRSAPVQYAPYDDDYPVHGKVRISFDMGFSRRIAKVPFGMPSEESRIVRGVLSGSEICASISYIGKKKIGIGAVVNIWNSNNSGEISGYYLEKQGTYRMDISDQMIFVGPAFVVRPANDYVAFNIMVGLGYYGYVSQVQISDKSQTGKGKAAGSTAGIILDFGLDIKIYKAIYIGLGFGALTGTIGQYEVTDSKGNATNQTLPEDQRESLLRIGAKGGVKLCF